MESQRRQYFKKQILKGMDRNKSSKDSYQDKKSEKENSEQNKDKEDSIITTVLGSKSYYEQNQRSQLINMKPPQSDDSNIEPQDKDANDGDITEEYLLQDITNKEVTRENVIENIEEIQIDIEFESIKNNEDVWTEERNLQLQILEEKAISKDIEELLPDLTNMQEQDVLIEPGKEIQEDISDSTDKQGQDVVQESETFQTKAIGVSRELENMCTQAEVNTQDELDYRLTEIMTEKELDIVRKSLEEDENAKGVDNSTLNNIPDDNQVQDINKEKIKRKKMKKSYVDFLSDEEDFEWDSTSWKETGDDSSTSESTKPKKKKKVISEDGKVGDSGLKKKKINKRKQAKSNREKGQEYLRKDGSIVSAKSLQPNPCLDVKCGHNCKEITEEKRKNIFNYFWGLSSQRKNDWLVSMTSRSTIKRKRTKDSGYRSHTYSYFINDGEGRRQVCKKFLTKTLGVSQKKISYTVANAYDIGLSKEDTRGKAVPKNKTPQTVKNSAINFIKDLPALPSHYCRKDSTRLYLPTELKNLKNLYRIYKEDQTSKGIDVVGEKVFRNIFNNEFNIGFHVPKKDKCVKCLRFEGQDENPEKVSHLKEKEASKNRLVIHRELCKKNESMICTSFDLQKVLNTPHGESMLLFYSRKYTVYNLCFYESRTRNGFCYTWGEAEGKRGSNEIATILQKYIADVDSRGSVTSLILYSDSCPGQNKNKIVLAAIHNALLEAKHIETIQMNYLLPGHTEMTVDSIHATIEYSVRNTIIWAPSQWATVFQLARKEPTPYYVESLTHTDFKNFEELADKYFKGNLTGKISKIRVATFKKSSPNVMTVKYTMMENAEPESIGIISRPKLLQQKYKTMLPITTAKYKDLKKLCDTGVIPKQFHLEYSNFNHRSGKDVLADTDIEDEIES